MKLWRGNCDSLNTPCWRLCEAGLTVQYSSSGTTVGSASDSVDHSILQRVKAALSTPVARIYFAELRVLLDAVPPNSLTISKKLTSSPLAFVRRMGNGPAPRRGSTPSMHESDPSSVELPAIAAPKSSSL